jgi:hypothetical protein
MPNIACIAFCGREVEIDTELNEVDQISMADARSFSTYRGEGKARLSGFPLIPLVIPLPIRPKGQSWTCKPLYGDDETGSLPNVPDLRLLRITWSAAR